MKPVYDIAPFLNKINRFILNPLIALMFVVALVTFLWGLVELIRSADSEDGREKGKRNIVWGIIGMLIMISVFGIVQFILSNLGISGPAYLQQTQ